MGLSSSFAGSARARTQRECLAHLQEAIYDLPADIGLMLGEEFALDQAVDAFCEAVLGLQVLGWLLQSVVRRSYLRGAYSGSLW